MAKLLKLTTVMTLSNLLPGYDKEQTSSLASLEAQWPAEQASQNAWRFASFIQECISVVTLDCASLTKCGPSKFVEHIFHALQDRTQTIQEK